MNSFAFFAEMSDKVKALNRFLMISFISFLLTHSPPDCFRATRLEVPLEVRLEVRLEDPLEVLLRRVCRLILL